jgi:hypothetical protein
MAYYDKDEKLIDDRWIISKKYLKTWFAVDFLSIIPFNIMFNADDYASLARIARLPKLYRLVKLTKMMRILRVVKERDTFIKYLTDVLKVNVGLERMAFFILLLFVSCHILSCVWVLLSSFLDDGPETWIVRADLINSSNFEQYISGFYFTVMIITTVGFGDINVTLPEE